MRSKKPVETTPPRAGPGRPLKFAAQITLRLSAVQLAALAAVEGDRAAFIRAAIDMALRDRARPRRRMR